MKTLSRYLVLATFLLLLFPQPTHADDGFTISGFKSILTVQADGHVAVEEQIDTVFTASKHGIFRDIPYAYATKDGSTLYTNIDVTGITDNGATAQYSISRNGANMRIQIGDPNQLISGEQQYDIHYTATGILQALSGYDELAWNVTGNGWNVPIGIVEGIVKLPSGVEIQKVSCSEGPAGSTEVCTSSKTEGSPATATFTSTREFAAGEGLTLYVDYTPGVIPILKGTVPPGVHTSSDYLPTGITALILLALSILFTYRIFQNSKQAEGITGHDTIMAIYDPPANLRPAELGVLLEEKASNAAVAATIVDLAVRGYVTITEIPKKGIFGSVDYQLHRTDKTAGSELLTYEKLVLSTLFSTGPDVLLSSLKNIYYKSLALVQAEMMTNAREKGYLMQSQFQARGKYTLIGALLMLVSTGAWFTWTLLNASLVANILTGICVGIALGGVVLLIVSFYLPMRTPAGHQMYVQAAGYKLFLSSTEKYQQPFLERQNIFMDILPYAIVFGVTKKLAQAFQALGVQPPAPNWYYGAAAFNSWEFANNLATFSSELSSTMASAPSSSGGGSGGGFGGGGGGSW